MPLFSTKVSTETPKGSSVDSVHPGSSHQDEVDMGRLNLLPRLPLEEVNALPSPWSRVRVPCFREVRNKYGRVIVTSLVVFGRFEFQFHTPSRGVCTLLLPSCLRFDSSLE